jgi:hypothetical protein
VRRTLLLASTLGVFLSVVLFCGGCATPGPAAAKIPPLPYFLSRDGAIRYHLPAGWFDVSADTVPAGRAVFLVRDDYAGSLTVRQVFMRAVNRGDLEGEGLLQVARLTAALDTSGRPGILVREPERYPVNGKEAVSYDVVYGGSGDMARTVLLAAEGRLYAFTAFVNGTAPPGAGKEIFGVLQTFIAGVRL